MAEGTSGLLKGPLICRLIELTGWLKRPSCFRGLSKALTSYFTRGVKTPLWSVWRLAGLGSLTWPRSDWTMRGGGATHLLCIEQSVCTLREHLLRGNMEHQQHVSFFANLTINSFFRTLCPCQEMSSQRHLDGTNMHIDTLQLMSTFSI